MKKIFGVIAVIALFFAVFPFARAESKVPVKASATSSQPTKWDILNLMQHGALQATSSYEATFTDDEINEFLNQELAQHKMTWFVDRAAVQFHADSADITLHVLRPFAGDLAVNVVPQVADGEASMVINSSWYGYLPWPSSFFERVGDFILKKKTIDDWFSIENGKWDAITLSDGSVTVKVSGTGEK